MAVESPASFLQASTYGAEQTRRTIASLIQRGASIGSIVGGLVETGDMEVTAGTLLHALVAPGEAWIPGTSSATQSGYYARVSSSSELAIAAADATNPRVDRISAIVKDAAYSGAENTFTVAVQTGTPTSGANLTNLSGAAAAPASSLTLGYVLVNAKATSVSGVSSVAAILVPGFERYLEGTLAARPAAKIKGRIYYATDTKAYFIDTGTAWSVLLTCGASSAYTATSKVATAATSYEHEYSAAIATLVMLEIQCVGAAGPTFEIKIGGVTITENTRLPASTGESPASRTLIIPPGQKLFVKASGTNQLNLWTSTLPLS